MPLLSNPFNPKDSQLERTIAITHAHQENLEPDSKEFTAIVDNQVKLYQLRPEPIKPDTIATVAGGLALGFGILWFERNGGLVTTRVGQFVKKFF